MTITPATDKRRFEPDRCADCFEPLPDDIAHRPWLYCSLPCQDTANTIRYWRKTSRNGLFEADPDVRYAIGIRLAHMLAGGYNSVARRIPLDVRALVIERDRVCMKCGGPGEEIDHIEGDSTCTSFRCLRSDSWPGTTRHWPSVTSSPATMTAYALR